MRFRTLGAMIGFCLTVGGCRSTDVQRNPTAAVTIGGMVFHLEIAAEEASRVQGLAHRASIEDRGGMIFVFIEPTWLEFVMRDCLIPLDLIYLDAEGRIVSVHTMQPEAPRRPEELPGDSMREFNYTSRLTPYPSGSPAQFAIEVRAGTSEYLGIRPGDTVQLDAASLTELAHERSFIFPE